VIASSLSLSSLDQQLLPLAGWLGTFALHSTFALAVTWAITRIWRQHALALQDTLLRQALWLPFLSSTLQCLFVGSPWRDLWAQPEPRTPLDVEAVMLALAELPAEASAPLAVAPAAAAEPTPWAVLAVGGAAACALFGTFLLWCSWRRLARVLAARRPEVDPRILSTASAMAGQLGLRQSPRISRAAGLTTPIAFGMVRPEICLPARAAALDDASLRAMLGHELAHLRRGDPLWMWLGAWIQALFPWQLLLMAVRGQLSRVVELRCDAEAVQHTSPTAVARCLVEVAEWLRGDKRAPLVALRMAARPSALRERVESALRGSRPPKLTRVLAAGLAMASLTALTLAAPGLQQRSAWTLDAGGVETPDATVAAGRSQLDELMVVVDEEYALLVDEAAQLRAELSRFDDAESRSLQGELQRRLSVLARLRAALKQRLARTSESR